MKIPNTLKARLRSSEDADFRSGWLVDEQLVVAFMTPDVADVLGRMVIRAASSGALPADEQEWVHAAIDLFTSAARATFLESPAHLVPVAKIALAVSAADLDQADHDNVRPLAAVPDAAPEDGRALVETTYPCACGDSHQQIGDALEAPADGRFHAPVTRGRKTT